MLGSPSTLARLYPHASSVTDRLVDASAEAEDGSWTRVRRPRTARLLLVLPSPGSGRCIAHRADEGRATAKLHGNLVHGQAIGQELQGNLSLRCHHLPAL